MTDTIELNLDYWLPKLGDYLADEEFQVALAQLAERRREIVPQMRDLLSRFLDGSVDLEGLRSEYDVRTRTEWEEFGTKGLSGAMFLNKLVKYVPDQERLTTALRETLVLPESPDSGGERMRAFASYLEELIEADVITRQQIQPGRLAFFFSSWWHLQDHEEWPIYYSSARDTFKASRSFEPTGDPVDSYFAFRERYLAVGRALDLSNWELEQFCVWIQQQMSTSGPKPLKPPDPTDKARGTWLVAPGANAQYWDEFYEQGVIGIGWNEIGDLSRFDTVDEVKKALKEALDLDAEPINTAKACHQFVHEMLEGDVVYAKKGRRHIVGRGTVTSDYIWDPSRKHSKSIRHVVWDAKRMWTPREKPLVNKTLTEIGKYPGLIRDIEAALGGDGPDDGGEIDVFPYGLVDAEAELFLARGEIEDLLALLRTRKNVILQGPPGTGKSFIASRLAWLALGGRDSSRLVTVQFHQSYSYEDFVQGYRPTESGGFERRDGPFMRFCNLALQDQDNDYVLIVDEINRGNLSKILGELMMLIELDKRGPQWATQLAYSTEDEEPFHVSPNLLIIGTMNTADRSLALVDYALRRRFAFVDVEPAFADPQFGDYLESLGASPILQELITSRMTELNRRIAGDHSLGRGFMIGHSYFCQAHGEDELSEVWLDRIVRTEIAPLLREYWFDNEEKAEQAMRMLLDDLP